MNINVVMDAGTCIISASLTMNGDAIVTMKSTQNLVSLTMTKREFREFCENCLKMMES